MAPSQWSLNTFIEQFAILMDRDASAIREDHLLVEDLALDSLDFLRVAVWFDELVPRVELPMQFDARDVRIADLYYYMTNAAS